MMPPTIATLRQLAAVRHGRRRARRRRRTRSDAGAGQARLEDGEIVLSWPGHEEFTKRIPDRPADR